jgi:hypothetical protein
VRITGKDYLQLLRLVVIVRQPHLRP